MSRYILYNSSMNPQTKSKLGSIFSKGLIYAAILYTFFMLGRAVWINFTLQKNIKIIEQEIAAIQQQNKNLENLILYYQSDSFREIEARQKLGLKKPGETVINVPVKKYDNYSSEVRAEEERLSDKPAETKTSNAKLWWQYFFK